MRQLTLWSLGITLLTAAALGCSGSDRSPLTVNTTNGSSAGSPAGLGDTYVTGQIAEGALALYSIQVDPTTLVASTSLKAQRGGQATDDLYGLPIGAFLRPDSLKITSITGEADVLRLGYRFTHPFAAPTDLDAPATAKNRIDLGIGGRVLFLLDSMDPTGDTYFDETGTGGGRVIAATDAIVDADGYYNPGAMVTGVFAANTFPYKVLVNERLDGRTSQLDGGPRSNGGSALGNYDSTLGWTRATLGDLNDGWTGMGFLHQGQAVDSSVAISKSYLASHNFAFDVAIIAKYIDPRGGAVATEKRANRLPAATADLSQFVYRAPHGSLDVESLTFAGESGGFLPNAISASTLSFHVVDWDAKATASDQADLASDTSSASKVDLAEVGVPTLAVCIPGLLGSASTITTLSAGAHQDDDSAFGGDAGADSGAADDPLFFSELVTKPAGSGQVNGVVTGLVRAVDVEDGLTPSLVLSLDGALQPLTSDVPRAVAYQAFTVALYDGNDAPTLSLSTPANVQSGTSTTLTIEAANDANGDSISVQIDWDNDSVYEDTQVIPSPYPTPIVLSSTVPKYNNTSLTPVTRSIPVRFTDGVMGSPIVYSPGLTFTLGANRAPEISGLPALVDATLDSPATFTLGAGTAVATDPEGDAITYRVANSVNATVASGGSLPIGGLGPFTNPPTTTVNFTLWATDLLHPATGAGPSNGTAFAPVSGTVSVPCTPTAALHTWTFGSGADGWTGGHLFTPQVFNSDNSPGNSRFYRCSSKSSQGAGFSGGCLTTGPHAVGGCGNTDSDYGPQVDNSIISPTINLTGKTHATLVFNSSKNGRTGTAARYKVWVSVDNGVTWLASNIIYDTEKTASGILNENNVPVNLDAYTGMNNLRVRFQFLDPTNSSYSVSSTQFAGWGVDNVRILACP